MPEDLLDITSTFMCVTPPLLSVCFFRVLSVNVNAYSHVNFTTAELFSVH